jgi:8-oxo-dGTP pyrophosphatase MutT (NUDIX family)
MQAKDNKKKPGAGIILVKYFDNQPKILGLMDHDAFDLPKGSMDPGESIIQCAFRETYEECDIVEFSFPWGFKYIALGNLTLFIAVTEEEPTIKRNPITRSFEHKFAKWLHFDEKYFKPMLRPAVKWAKSIVNGDNRVDF